MAFKHLIATVTFALAANGESSAGIRSIRELTCRHSGCCQTRPLPRWCQLGCERRMLRSLRRQGGPADQHVPQRVR